MPETEPLLWEENVYSKADYLTWTQVEWAEIGDIKMAVFKKYISAQWLQSV